MFYVGFGIDRVGLWLWIASAFVAAQLRCDKSSATASRHDGNAAKDRNDGGVGDGLWGGAGGMPRGGVSSAWGFA